MFHPTTHHSVFFDQHTHTQADKQAGERTHTHFKDIAFQNGAIELDRVVKKKKGRVYIGLYNDNCIKYVISIDFILN
jgi:hypothetical protein